MNDKPKTLTFLIAAALVLGACQPATATPPVAPAPSAAAGTPGASTPSGAATSEPTAASVTPAAAASFKSKDPTTFTYVPAAGEPDTFDPAEDYETTGGQVIQNTYDTLIFYDKEKADQFVPQLATEVPSQANGDISADGKTYTFKIRASVKFHNGDLLTPDDVAYTFQRGLLQGGNNSPQWLLFQPILGATGTPNNDIADLVDPSGNIAATDDYTDLLKADTTNLLSVCQKVTSAIVADDAAGTVTFHLAQSWGPFLATLAGTWGSITDARWVKTNGGWDGDCHTWQKFYAPSSSYEDNLPIGSGENGTGPYRLDHWTPKQEVVLKAFDGYWRTAPAWPGGPTGAPRLKTIVIQTNVPKFDQRLALLQARDADVVDQDFPNDWLKEDPLVGETCDAAGGCQPAPNPNNPLRVFKGLQSNARSDLFLNFKMDTTGGNDFIGSGKLDGAGVPPDFFSDVHVRKAFNYCFDWSTYLKHFQLGEGAQSYDVMLPGEIGTSANDPHYEFDAEKCKAEFQASTLKSADGASLWDTGFRLTIAYNSNPQLNVVTQGRQVAEQILSQNLKAVNPKFIVDVIDLPWPTYLAAQQNHKLPILILGWIEDIHDPHDWVLPWVTSWFAAFQSLPPDLVQQLSVFINQGAQETDPARRAAIYQQFNQAYYAAAPVILLTVEYNRHYEQRWVQGFYYNSIYASYYFYALSKQ